MRSLWPLPSTPPYLVNTAPFFQYLLGPHRLFLSKTNPLAQAIKNGTLVACSDGSYDPLTGFGSHGWGFATLSEQILIEGQD
jgi:hypothetical protein